MNYGVMFVLVRTRPKAFTVSSYLFMISGCHLMFSTSPSPLPFPCGPCGILTLLSHAAFMFHIQVGCCNDWMTDGPVIVPSAHPASWMNQCCNVLQPTSSSGKVGQHEHPRKNISLPTFSQKLINR